MSRVKNRKTEYMCLNGLSRGSVHMEEHQLPEVQEFKYLGSMIQTDRRVEAEISRIKLGWNNWNKIAGVMFGKKIPTTVKGKIHRIVSLPAMLYALETVPQTKKTTRRLEVAKMKMCRWAYGATGIDGVKNEDNWERMGVTKIGVLCRRARLRCFGHVKRR